MLVNRCCCGGTPYTCEGCTITTAPLTISWENATLGNGSAVLTFVSGASNDWQGSVPGQLTFLLRCLNVGGPKWTLAVNATGAGTCERFGFIGAELVPSAYTCSPFLLEHVVINAGAGRCPSHYALGYRKYTVTL